MTLQFAILMLRHRKSQYVFSERDSFRGCLFPYAEMVFKKDSFQKREGLRRRRRNPRQRGLGFRCLKNLYTAAVRPVFSPPYRIAFPAIRLLGPKERPPADPMG